PARPLLARLQHSGFVIVRNTLSATDLTTLRGAATRLTSVARCGAWPHVRTVGKQFPPWDASAARSAGIWGVQHLLHPDLPLSTADRAAFARVYFSDAVLRVVRELLEMDSDEQLVMELFNMLVRPGTEAEPMDDFALRWHRDDIPWEATADEEEARLSATNQQQHAQFNLALYDDASLIVVPGSHARARTAAERGADPYDDGNAMPGAAAVALAPGDIVFYDNNIVHRGVYAAGRERATLHGSVGRAAVAGADDEAANARARNVLQHGVGAYVDRCDFSGLPQFRTAEAMRRRLVDMGRQHGDVGYSLSG
ncbi:hypothetical protein B0T26DRAFT_616229, partial [Lasiosphaeria miniovina]